MEAGLGGALLPQNGILYQSVTAGTLLRSKNAEPKTRTSTPLPY